MSLLPETATAARRTKFHVLKREPPPCHAAISASHGFALYTSFEKCLVYIVSEFPFKFASLCSFTKHFVHFKKKMNLLFADSFVLVPALPKGSPELCQITPQGHALTPAFPVCEIHLCN